MSRRKIYLAGPMRGKPGWNFAEFHRVQRAWEAEGWQVFNPATLAVACGYPQDESQVDRTHLLHVIQQDLACIYVADAIALLPGWESSAGATVELALAQFLRLMVYNAETGLPMQAPSKPWRYIPKSAYVGESY